MAYEERQMSGTGSAGDLIAKIVVGTMVVILVLAFLSLIYLAVWA